MPRRSGTRERLIRASTGLFRRQGYSGTGLKEIAATSEASLGSLYHFFPGGKEELAAEVIAETGHRDARLIERFLERAATPADGIRDFFRLGAEALAGSAYADGCPVASVVLDTANTSEPLREACARALAEWVDVVSEALQGAGVDLRRSRSLATYAVAAYEGAVVLARALRSTDPLEQTGRIVADEVRRQVGGTGGT